VNPIRWFSRGLLELLVPPCCHFCAIGIFEPRTQFCAACELALLGDVAPTCSRCAATLGPHLAPVTDCSLCRGHSLAFEGVCRLGEYDGKLREAVLMLKDGWNETLAEVLGRSLAPRIQAAWPGEPLTAVVPIPLHWWRRFRRGYNQSAAIAHGAAEILGVPVASWLRRRKATAPQYSLSATARKENVKDAFEVCSPSVTGAKILLIDDVLTTGSTCHEAARCLLAAGADSVKVAVLARAGD